ncbi:LPO_1073/Vpar_1526 family protein [Synechococcus sp. PCC 7336]|uniref:LPO_1073/Vpar_1526 family protein n=1 Tax=Synechococcus sp. PCC 7336 TaxID=195250 RepID=UPI000349A44F|nr:LPO_1073/Vpar_1526 family protein [Synechococcus sp. PCC 7336]
MSSKANQRQESGNNSLNLQAASISFNQGVSYSEARQIALDVFSSNFVKLADEAANIAETRVRQFIDNYLDELEARQPEALVSAKDPDMQYILYEAQKMYARTGDDFLAELLIELLVKRAPLRKRSFVQVVLNEALETIGKITSPQMYALSVIFLVDNLLHERPDNIDEFLKLMNSYLIPMSIEMPNISSAYLYLEYTGCVRSGFSGTSFIDILRMNYMHIFSNIISSENYLQLSTEIPMIDEFLRTCQGGYKFRVKDLNEFDEILGKVGIQSDDEIRNKRKLFTEFVADSGEVRNFLIQNCPNVEILFDRWKRANNYRLTSVGFAIAQTHLKKTFGLSYRLSDWLSL